MKMLAPALLLAVTAACAGQDVPLNSDFSAPTSPSIVRSLALRDRYGLPKHLGQTAILVDSVAVHHIFSEASTIVWREKDGQWLWNQAIEVGPGGGLPVERKLVSNTSRTLKPAEAAALDRLLRNKSLYRGASQTIGSVNVGAAAHVMSIITPFGRKTIEWDARLVGIRGAVADIVLGTG